MNELPKRIMAWGHFGDDSVTGQWSSNTYHNDNVVEYVRADLAPQWQPIETAPKDGTWLLVSGHIGSNEPDNEGNDLRIRVARFGGNDWFFECETRYPERYDTDGINDEPILAYWETDYWDGGWRSVVWGPTHWMSLPKAPT